MTIETFHVLRHSNGDSNSINISHQLIHGGSVALVIAFAIVIFDKWSSQLHDKRIWLYG